MEGPATGDGSQGRHQRGGRGWSCGLSLWCWQVSAESVPGYRSISPWWTLVEVSRGTGEHLTLLFIEEDAASRRADKSCEDTQEVRAETTAPVACGLLGCFDKHSH